MGYNIIPANIIPNGYYPLLYNGFNGSYIYKYDETIESLILHPRNGLYYNMDVDIYASNHSGNVPLFNQGKKVWINRYELIEENEKFIEKINIGIRTEYSKIKKQRLGMEV